MTRRARWAAIAALVSLAGVSALGGQPSVFPKYAIKAAKILTMKPAAKDGEAFEVINHGVILVGDGKIQALGPANKIAIPRGYRLIHAADRWAMPGVVEPHTHIGAGWDFNDMVMPLNPELHLADRVDPEEAAVKHAVTGGVTTIHTMPGSGTNLAGFTVILKLDGSRIDDSVVREPAAMKIAQAYNPERDAGDLGRTRMGMSWMLRHILRQAKEYTEAWQAYEQGQRKEKPVLKPALESMRLAFEGKIPTIVHTYQSWGVMQAMRMLHDEFGLWLIVTHAQSGGYVLGSEAARRGRVFIDIGPGVIDFLRGPENDTRVHGVCAEYVQRGVKNISLNTDSIGWGGQEGLPFCGALSAHFGLDDLTALKALTINPARALGIEDRVGSLEVGKDADIVVKKGSYLEVTSPVNLVLINGRIVYRRDGFDYGGRGGASTAQKAGLQP